MPTPAQSYDAPALWRAMQAAQAVMVDVRTRAEFSAGHAPGAIHVALYEDDVDHAKNARTLRPDFVDRIQSLRHATPADRTLVMACRTGARSRQAVQVLRAYGVDNIGECPAGWDGRTDSWGRVTAVGWCDSGLPITRDGKES